MIIDCANIFLKCWGDFISSLISVRIPFMSYENNETPKKKGISPALIPYLTS